MEVLIIIFFACTGIFAIGYYIGRTVTNLKYGAKLDNYRIQLDYKDDRIHDLNKQLKREMEKNYARKNH